MSNLNKDVEAQLERRVEARFAADPALLLLQRDIASATAALHARQKSIVHEEKQALGIRELTDFECLLGERQAGVC